MEEPYIERHFSMFVKLSKNLGKKLTIIYPGEYYISTEGELIGALLGSCVAVCLYDEKNKIGAMNHFMLPGRTTRDKNAFDEYTRYGLASINLIIDEILKRGAKKGDLSARVFGGGHIIKTFRESGGSLIPADNVRIAKLIMEMEDIPIVSQDVGGNMARKIIFDTDTGKVYLRRIESGAIYNRIEERESKLKAG